MYENKNEPLLTKSAFRIRVFYHVLAAFALLLVTLALGIAGHMYFDGMALTSALVASITLMSGLGLSILPESVAGQLFASVYGILSSYLYIATSSIVIAPILHRLLHKFHLQDE